MSSRKFRVWDNNYIFHSYEKALQIKHKIDHIATTTRVSDMPLCAVPPDVLYELVTCYQVMYDRLLEENLIVAGYPKTTNKLH